MYCLACRLLNAKKKELGDAANKLKNGLSKIDDTREKVEKMSVELEDAKGKVAQFQKQCEEYLVVIVQQKREADEQQKVSCAHTPRTCSEHSEHTPEIYTCRGALAARVVCMPITKAGNRSSSLAQVGFLFGHMNMY